MGKIILSRRGFLKTAVVAGITVYLAPLNSQAYEALFTEKVLDRPHWDPKTKRIKFRTDAIAKATGDKVFAMDIRSRDLPHWPQQQAHAFILRVTEADKIYEGFDLSRLSEGLMPTRIITSEDLMNDNIAIPEFYGTDLLLPIGQIPAYLGQAVAILIYDDFAKFRFAKDALKFKNDVIRYGEFTGYLEREPWSIYRGVRIGHENPYQDDIYSSMKDGTITPIAVQKQLPVWPKGRKEGSLDKDGIYYANKLQQSIDNPPDDWLVIEREYHTSSVDLSPMEPDNTNGWYDPKTQSLHMVVAVQAPIDVIESIVEMYANANIPVKKVFLHPCSTVGYGTKEHSIFPLYGIVAATYGNGLPVRLACDRYEHFQSGLKRHPFDIKYTLAVNKKTEKIEALIGHFVGNGGGRANFTPSVMSVSATAAQCGYYIPKSDFTSIGLATRALDAGSARGYGTIQTMAAMDVMMDEVSRMLNADPIQFRIHNMIQSGMKNTQGAIPGGALRYKEVLTRCTEHPMWTERAQRKAEFEKNNLGKLFSTGIGFAPKNFGTGAESAFVRIDISPEGQITLYHSGPEIGTGSSTAQPVVCAKWLGRPSDVYHAATTDWDLLPMYETTSSFALTREQQDEAAKDPLWTPAYCSPSSASNSAFFYSHVTSEASELLFDYGIWPAALSIWREGYGGGQAAPFAVKKEDARWTERGLTANNMEPLTLERIAKRMYEQNHLTGIVAHGFNRWEWAEADFIIQNQIDRRLLDGISLKWGAETYQINRRESVTFPSVERNRAGVTHYSPLAVVVELYIEKKTGEVNILAHHSVLECGSLIVPELVEGQIEGGVSMGIGHALYEHLPLYEDGPGNGTWNFNRYHIPLAKEVAVWTQTHEILEPLSDTDHPKGMAEVVVIPIVSAITNAIAAATGHYFNSYPIRPEHILEVLKK